MLSRFGCRVLMMMMALVLGLSNYTPCVWTAIVSLCCGYTIGDLMFWLQIKLDWFIRETL